MPRAKRAPVGEYVQLNVRLPGGVKNEVMRAAKRNKATTNAWLVQVLRRALREEWGLPEPPPAVSPLATISDEIESIATKRPIITPCGKVSPCDGTNLPTLDLDGMSFCRSCDIRVR